MKSRLSLAEVFKRYAQKFLEITPALPQYVKFAIWSLQRCQTPELGGHVVQCDQCGRKEIVYNSCRHRACPQCEGPKAAKWMAARAKELLPVHYFHVIFTLPHTLNPLILDNQKICYELFFNSVKKTLLTIGKNNLAAKLGFFAILHTWGQKLSFHPHIHCVVPGGGISVDGKSWVSSSKTRHYFVSQKILATVFRGIFIRAIKEAYRRKKITIKDDLEKLLTTACTKDWIVHCKPPFGGPHEVIKYLSRYTRKVAIANSRIISLENGQVSFSFKDYADNAKTKIAKLPALEFIRRFLMHIPAPAFIRIRHFGFLANSCKLRSLKICRELLLQSKDLIKATPLSDTFHPGRCPHCAIGTLIPLADILPVRPIPWNSS